MRTFYSSRRRGRITPIDPNLSNLDLLYGPGLAQLTGQALVLYAFSRDVFPTSVYDQVARSALNEDPFANGILHTTGRTN